jgi:hypothetical protein
MPFRIDEAELVQALDRRVLSALPTEWPTPGAERSPSVSDHFDYVEMVELGSMPRHVAVALVVEHANNALAGFSGGVSEDAREPYGGVVTIEGDLLRVRFGRLPHSHPDARYLADELEPIPIRDIIIDL